MSELVLRRATDGDSADVLRWRNDDVTRQMSFSNEPIKQEAHDVWYDGKLLDGTIWIGDVDGESVGVVHVRGGATQGTMVSINVAPEHRGKGYGTAMLNELTQMQRYAQKYGYLEAVIMWMNQPSIKAFERAGYQIHGDELMNGIHCWIYRKELDDE
jgi:RimJ/RimL family protein N-acetyltransferase